MFIMNVFWNMEWQRRYNQEISAAVVLGPFVFMYRVAYMFRYGGTYCLFK